MKKILKFSLVLIVIFNINTASISSNTPSSFADLAEQLMPSVVNISTTTTVVTKTNPFPNFQFPPGSPFEDMFKEFGTPQERKASALGSGFIIDKNGKVADAQAVKLDKESGASDSVYLLTEKAVVQEIPMDEISIYGRSTQGSTLMKLQPGDKISAIRAVSSDSSINEEEPKKGDNNKKSKK